MKRVNFSTKLPLTEHLIELRSRLVIAASAVLICSGASFLIIEHLINILERPLPESFNTLSFISPTEGFFVAMKVSVFSGIIFSFPLLLHQVWSFVSPGLKENERKIGVPLIFFGTVFFLTGVSFGYFAILPLGLNFLLTFGAKYWTPTITVANYLSFCIKLLLGFGAAFELPLVIALLCKAGIITTSQLIQYRKYAVLGVFVVASILTPPDVITQIFMALPLILLYEVGIYAGKLLEKKKKESEKEESDA